MTDTTGDETPPDLALLRDLRVTLTADCPDSTCPGTLRVAGTLATAQGALVDWAREHDHGGSR
jgi:hypothetical protein